MPDGGQQLGSHKGDEALRTVAKTLSLAANDAGDFIARIVGEEFVWLLPHTSQDKARRVAEKCMQLVRQQQIAHEKSDVSPLLTLSLSLSLGTVTPTTGESAMAFIEEVDALLYRVKRNGRMRAKYGEF